MAAATTVVRIPNVQLYQVVNMQHTYLWSDVLLFNTHSNGQGYLVYASVGHYSWRIDSTLPVLRSQPNMYVFAVEGQPGFFFCVVLPSDVAPEAVSALEGILRSTSNFQDQVHGVAQSLAGQPFPMAMQEPLMQPSSKVAQTILKGSNMLAAGLVMAGGAAAQGVAKASEYAISKTTPAATPTQVRPETQARLEKAREVSSATASMAKAASDGVISLSSQAAVAMVNTFSGSKKDPNAKPSAVKEVGVASLLAFSTVWDAMWEAGKVVMDASKEHGSKVVEHKYGADAAKASRVSMGVAVDCVQMARAVMSVRPSAIMKHTAKQAAKETGMRMVQ